jgi:hypothetical protein
MNRKTAFTALSVAIVLGSASAAFATTKKHTDARQAYGSEAGGISSVDPRDAYWAKRKGPNTNPGWCDMDAQCNGWGQWLEEVSTGKRKAE